MVGSGDGRMQRRVRGIDNCSDSDDGGGHRGNDTCRRSGGRFAGGATILLPLGKPLLLAPSRQNCQPGRRTTTMRAGSSAHRLDALTAALSGATSDSDLTRRILSSPMVSGDRSCARSTGLDGLQGRMHCKNGGHQGVLEPACYWNARASVHAGE